MSNRRQAIIWTNDDKIYWHIYAALERDDLNQHVKLLMQQNAFENI